MATYLVTGATGAQGGSTVNYLLAAGAKVHAVVRDPSSAKAIALRDRGVVLFKGAHETPDVFREAAKGCSGLFLNPSVYVPEEAKRQSASILAASKAGAGDTLTTVVLSSTGRTPELSNDPTVAEVDPALAVYYAAKGAQEVAVREAGFPHYTILRPAVLMHDILLPFSAGVFPGLAKTGVLVTSLEADVGIGYLDENDVGKVAAAALLDPAKFSGHEIDLAGETLTAQGLCDVLARVSGQKIQLRKRTAEQVEEDRQTAPFQKFELLQNSRPSRLESKEVETKYGIKLATVAEYLERKKEKLLDSLPHN